MAVCYLNGEYLPLIEAKIPVLDRGFIFGDGVYEVIPAFGRELFRIEQHLGRLTRSLEAVEIANPLSNEAWVRVLRQLVAVNDGEDQSLYVHVTRGVAARSHAPGSELAPTVFVMATPLVRAEPVPVGVTLIDDIRWSRCDIKAISLLPNVLFRQAAARAGVYEAILLRDGEVTEGAASNIFVVRAGRIITPPHSRHLLPGVTRDLLVELLAGTDSPVIERTISRAELLSAGEVWLTSSGRELLPVATIDGQPVGTQCPGPEFRRVRALYERFKTNARP